VIISTLGGPRVPVQGIAERVQLFKGKASIGQSNFVITSAKMPMFDGIVGRNFLTKVKAVLDFGKDTMKIADYEIPFVKTIQRIDCNMLNMSMREIPPEEDFFCAALNNYEGPVRVRAAEKTIFKQGTVGYLKVICPRKSEGSTLIVKPDYLAPGLSARGIALGGCCIRSDETRVTYLPIMNVSSQDVQFEKGDVIAKARPVKNDKLLFQLNCEYDDDSDKENLDPNKPRPNDNQTPPRPLRKEEFVNEVSCKLHSVEKPRELVTRQCYNSSCDSARAPRKLVNGKSHNFRTVREPRKLLDEESCNFNVETLLQSKTKKESPSRIPFKHYRQSNDLMEEMEMDQMDRLLDSTRTRVCDDKHLRELIEDMLKKSECPSQLVPQLRSTLWEHRSVLAEGGDSVGLCTSYKPRIPLNTDEPVYTPQYPVPFKMREAMQESVEEFLKMGIIKPSTSPYNSPSLMVAKRDGGFRLVVDFRNLNKAVITDPHPLPRIPQMLEALGAALYFTVLDLLHGFYNLEINAHDQEKTAFSTFDGHWEFRRLPMGLKNSPSVFQRLMQIVLSGCLGIYAFIYIDDILVYSNTPEDHLKHLKVIFEKLDKAGLKIKASKCQLFKSEVEYLGYLTGKDGLKVNPRKLTSIKDFPTPVKVRDIQAFLGLVGYFRAFVSRFAERARPLYALLKKEVEWYWGKDQEAALLDLKLCLMQAPVLSFPDFKFPFILTTDASGYAIGAILTQLQDGKEKLIGCASRVLTDVESRYVNTDRETLGVVYGIQAFRSYLWGNKFTVFTDNTAIAAISQHHNSTERRALRWYVMLSEYDFELKHRQALTMRHVDALSRYPPEKKPDETLYSLEMISTIMEYLVFHLAPSWQADSYDPILDLNKWEEFMKNVPTPTVAEDSKFFFEREGYLLYKVDKIDPTKKLLFVPEGLRKEVMRLFHDPPSQGHPGQNKMIGLMQTVVYWNSMTRDVRTFVASCTRCQQYKTYNTRTPLAGRPVPYHCMDEVSMDIVGPVPSAFSGVRYVLCIQDRFSRFLVFAPMKDATSLTTIRTFLQYWVCVHGAPKKIVTDRGSNFMSELFRELCTFLGVRHSPTTAYRPQGNAENERAHRELHTYLAMYLQNATRTSWDLLLAYAASVHNNTFHVSLQRTPSEVATGRKARSIQTLLPLSEDKQSTLEEYYDLQSKQLQELEQETRLAIAKAQAATRERANKHAIMRDWKVGQQIWVRSHALSYVGRKWSEKYKGPYVIKEVISPQTLKISLLSDPSHIDIVHTSYVRTLVERTGEDSDEDEDESQDPPDPLSLHRARVRFKDFVDAEEKQAELDLSESGEYIDVSDLSSSRIDGKVDLSDISSLATPEKQRVPHDDDPVSSRTRQKTPSFLDSVKQFWKGTPSESTPLATSMPETNTWRSPKDSSSSEDYSEILEFPKTVRDSGQSKQGHSSPRDTDDLKTRDTSATKVRRSPRFLEKLTPKKLRKSPSPKQKSPSNPETSLNEGVRRLQISPGESEQGMVDKFLKRVFPPATASNDGKTPPKQQTRQVSGTTVNPTRLLDFSDDSYHEDSDMLRTVLQSPMATNQSPKQASNVRVSPRKTPEKVSDAQGIVAGSVGHSSPSSSTPPRQAERQASPRQLAPVEQAAGVDDHGNARRPQRAAAIVAAENIKQTKLPRTTAQSKY